MILGLDPAATTGWALRNVEGALIQSGQDPATEIEQRLATFDDVRITHLAIEDGYYSEKSIRQSRNMEQFAKHEKRVGMLVGWMRARHPELRTLWVVYPSVWRAALRRAGLKMPQNPRSECKRMALVMAREEGAECVGPKGGKREDEADAICISRACYLHYFGGGK